jgi:signal transduction histidine kinase
MTEQAMNDSQSTQIDYICVAAGLLKDMMLELEALKFNNRRLTLAMASAGHDLRSRLHRLLGTVERLTTCQDTTRTADLSQRARSLIFELAEELEDLARQAEKDHAHPAPLTHRVAISSLLGQVEKEWECEARDKHLQFNVAQTDCLVQSDQRLLATIMNNVVGNAIRHTSQGSVSVESSIEGRFLILAVIDTGPGIPEDDLLRSLRFASRSGADKQGMGLGLCIARKSAQLLGHYFDVETAPNAGTCVRLHLPLA